MKNLSLFVAVRDMKITRNYSILTSSLSYLSDGLLSELSLCEGDEGVSAVQTGHRVHHESEVPDRAALLKQGDQLILV